MSKLRCRIGDIVVVLTGDNYGKLGTVERRLFQQEAAMFPRDVLHWKVGSLGAPFRVTDADITRHWASDHVLANDAELRPLRDDPGKDEMLRITGKPKQRGKAREASHG